MPCAIPLDSDADLKSNKVGAIFLNYHMCACTVYVCSMHNTSDQ